MSKKRKPLTSSFVVTFASTASILIGAAGCENHITTTNPPPTTDVDVDEECPAAMPIAGGACSAAAVPASCSYGDEDECDGYVIATCEGSQWVLNDIEVFCNPPPPLECPDQLPVAGEYCDGYGSCEYADACGNPIVVTCPLQEYELDYQGPPCNPPPPCFFNETAESCALDPSCQWLVPGCDDGTAAPLQKEGCYSATACAVDADCNPGNTCTTVGVEYACPPDEPCACSTPLAVCM